MLLERRLLPFCGPRLCRPGLELRLVVHLLGLCFVVDFTTSLQALSLWLVRVHRGDDVHRSGRGRVPGVRMNMPAWSMKPTVSRCGSRACWLLWGCHRQARRCLFLSTWLSAFSRATLCWSTGCQPLTALTRGVRGLRLLEEVFRHVRRCDGGAALLLLPDCDHNSFDPYVYFNFWMTWDHESQTSRAREGVFRHERHVNEGCVGCRQRGRHMSARKLLELQWRKHLQVSDHHLEGSSG